MKEALIEALKESGEQLAATRLIEGGCFFISKRDDEHAPFKLGGFCEKEGLYPEFFGFTDFNSAFNFLSNLR
jgi:hypothetical protein